MSVIAEISLHEDEFELGRVFDLNHGETVELESLVPVDGSAVPFFWVYDADFRALESRVREHPSVGEVAEIDRYDDRMLYTFEWDGGDDVFDAVTSVDGYVLNATGTADSWRFELRFPSHEAMSAFQDDCQGSGVDFEVIRVYDPSKPDLGPWFGLTERQREAIVLAVERGYYDIPRGCTTVDLADELGISDQAVTERLRRAIVTLVSNTILTSPNK